jgi:RimJ/RimL family protein N-acetyltransferase
MIMLKGRRVMLCAIEEAHLPVIAGWRSDGASYPYFHEFRPISLADQAAWFGAQRARSGELNFAVTTLVGELVGTISLIGIDGRNRRAELGRVLVGESRQRREGFGKEMTYLALAYAFDHLNVQKVHCEVIAENSPARQLYDKFGFKEEGVLRHHVFKAGRYSDVALLALFEQDWRKSPGEHVRTCRAEIDTARS